MSSALLVLLCERIFGFNRDESQNSLRLPCHVCFVSFRWPCLYGSKLEIIIVWMTSFIKFVFRLFTLRFCLLLYLSFFLSSFAHQSNLYFTSSSDSKSIYLHIHWQSTRWPKRLELPTVSYSLDLRNRCLIRIRSVCFSLSLSTSSNIRRKKISNELHVIAILSGSREKEGSVIVARSSNKISRSSSLSLPFHCLFRTSPLSLFYRRHRRKWNVVDNSMPN